jgi:hypothetical protein
LDKDIDLYLAGTDIIMRFQPTSGGFTAGDYAQQLASHIPNLTLLIGSRNSGTTGSFRIEPLEY